MAFPLGFYAALVSADPVSLQKNSALQERAADQYLEKPSSRTLLFLCTFTGGQRMGDLSTLMCRLEPPAGTILSLLAVDQVWQSPRQSHATASALWHVPFRSFRPGAFQYTSIAICGRLLAEWRDAFAYYLTECLLTCFLGRKFRGTK